MSKATARSAANAASPVATPSAFMPLSHARSQARPRAAAAEITPPPRCGQLEALVGQPRALAELESDPGALGLDSRLTEIGKLTTPRSLGLVDRVE
jgi:hypothetical protein